MMVRAMCVVVQIVVHVYANLLMKNGLTHTYQNRNMFASRSIQK